MKKSLFILAAAVLGSVISCQKESDTPTPQEQGVRVTVIAGADTKTAIVDNGTSSTFTWTNTRASQVHLFENGIEGTEPTIELSDSDAKAAMSATFSESATKFSYTALVTSSMDADGNALLPGTQFPTASSFDPTADILVGKPTDEVTSRPAKVDMQFGRAVAVNKMILSGFRDTDEKVKTVIFEAANNLVGKVCPVYSSGMASYLEDGASGKIILDYGDGAEQTEGEFNVYFLTFPVNTGNFKVKVITDEYVYTKSVSSGSVTFKLDKMTYFSFGLSDANFMRASESSKEYVLVTDVNDLVIGSKVMILNASGETRYAMGEQKSSNRAGVGVTVSDNVAVANDKCEIFTLESGTKANTYSFKAADGYIYAASSSSNQLKTGNTLSDNSSFLVTIEEGGSASVIAQGSNERKILRYNPNNGAPLFNCYGFATVDAVSIYQHDNRYKPTVTPTAKAITTLDTQDVSEMFSSTSDGEISYSVSGGQLKGTIFTPEGEGEYTVTFTQLPTDVFTGAVVEAKITVTKPVLEATVIEATADNTNKTITVEWVDVENATNYTVHCNTNTVKVETGVETHTFTGLSYGVEYTVYVTASAQGYNSSDSNQELITLTDPKKQDLESPVVETSVIGTTVTVSWEDVANATSYYVECGSQNKSVNTDVQQAQFTATAGSYEVYVTAKADGYNDGKSGVKVVKVYEQLATPTNFAAGTVTKSTIPVSWTAVPNAGLYQVSKDNSIWTDVEVTSYTFEGLDASTTYDLYVRAKETGYYTASEPAHIQAKTSIAEVTYTWNPIKSDFSTSGGTVTKSDITWTYPSITYLGTDASKGVQIGSGSNPQTSFNLNTEGFGDHTIKSIKVNASKGSNGTAKLTIKVNDVATSVNNQSLTTSAANYSATNINASGKVEIIFSTTSKAYYLKSVEVVYE